MKYKRKYTINVGPRSATTSIDDVTESNAQERNLFSDLEMHRVTKVEFAANVIHYSVNGNDSKYGGRFVKEQDGGHDWIEAYGKRVGKIQLDGKMFGLNGEEFGQITPISRPKNKDKTAMFTWFGEEKFSYEILGLAAFLDSFSRTF
jgi:hypothetical protein